MNFYVAVHALINNEGKYLFLKRALTNDYTPNKWDIPGGTIKTRETPYDALKRELIEETGLEVNINKVLYIHTDMKQLPKRQTFQIIFDCEYITGKVALNPEEHSEYIWASLEEISKYDTISFLKQFINSKI